MENGQVVQFLIIAGVIAYGIWSAAGGKRGGERSPHRMPGGENFPFPAPESVSETDSDGASGRESHQSDRLQRAAEEELNGSATEETAAVSPLRQQNEEGNGDRPLFEESEQKQPEVPDLRAIIISNELLNPKYREY